ncbi:DHHC palmitoyltransferase-domain-containing protein [Bisporella sp. PMI_857]|nr:DHHC palmitoyltransferase-domain-containing protein [Bisporella sp. PMI_857]
MRNPGKPRNADLQTARIIPFVVLGIIGYSSYVLIKPLCVNYLLVKHDNIRAAAPILSIHCALLVLMLICFIRLIHITLFDPPYVPLGPSALRNQQAQYQKSKSRRGMKDIGAGEYEANRNSDGTSSDNAEAKNDPDSPGLELFYTKVIFRSEVDGRPTWCSSCQNWKPDRAHHCSSSNRCILRMDHFCPWVGGPLGETNYKFFLQVLGYGAIYCIQMVTVMAIYLRKQKVTQGESVNPQFAVVLGLAGFFGFFSGGLFAVSFYGTMRNMTQVEEHGSAIKVHTLAVLKPDYDEVIRVNPNWNSNPTFLYPQITYPLEYSQSKLAQGLEHPSKREGEPQVVDRPEFPPSTILSLTSQQTAPVQTTANSIVSSDPTVAPPAHYSGNRSYSREKPSARDQLAKRTFSILQTREGENPWDQGSYFRNIQCVLGRSIFEWFVPFKRSPLCNHEDSRSYYSLGPSVDRLIATLYFREANDETLTEDRYPPYMRIFLESLKQKRHEEMQAIGRATRNKLRSNDLENQIQMRNL